ncbi:MAG: IS66 family transposase [Blastocatellia bacterium]
MQNHEEIPTADTDQIERLLDRVKQGKLEPDDAQLIERLLQTLLTLVSLLQGKNTTIRRLKELLFGSKERKKSKDQSEESSESPASSQEEASQSDSSQEKASGLRSEGEVSSEASSKPKRRGHGRIPASAYTGATVIRLDHPHLKAGDACPDPHCEGRLHKLREPNTKLYLVGQPIIGATKYERQVLRCTGCEQRIAAALPAGVSEKEKFDPTADVTIALLKYGAGLPFYRQARLQEICGVPLPEPVQFERCEKLADAALPVFLHLSKLAADGKLFYIDDTGVRILSCLAENKDREETERQGTHTSGIVVKDEAGRRIALYHSSRQHAGENLEDVLGKRNPALAAPMKMSDASSVNGKKTAPTVDLNCLAHGRGKFKQIEENFPVECQQVLDAIKKAYAYDALTKRMSDQERLEYHQKHSGPVMRELRDWIEEQFEEKKVEPNSGLGKALQYLRNHWTKLTGFLSVPGAPLDNNEVERALKRFVLFRKNSLFYKTEHGADVGDLLMSLIETCRLNQANPFEYLLVLLRNKDQSRRNPSAYLPWNYPRGRAEQEAEARAA